MQINFSIITVAKGRIETFRKACDAIWELAYDPYQIEHIILYDHGDTEMINYMAEYVKKYPQLRIFSISVKLDDYDNRNMHRDYWNVGANASHGEIIFGLCNDTIINTKHYDKIMLDTLADVKQKVGHSVFQFLVDDDSGKIEEYPVNWFCSWIILTRKALQIFNGLAPEELPFQGADRAVFQVMNQTIKPSQINMRDSIKTLHISHYTGRAEVDEITKHRPKNFNNPCVLNQQQMNNYINKANSFILELE